MTRLDEALAATRYQSYVYAYPHKTAYRRIEPGVPLGPLWAGERRDALFAYFHIPFCEQRCGFCNLFTRPVPPEELVTAYMTALARQVAVVRRALDEGGAFQFARAAIGGGTPTLLAPAQLEQLFGLVRAIGARAEIPMSVETSPETALPDRLAVVVAGGADRISIGVQSFIESECKAVNRPQQPGEVHRALRAIRDAGPATLNVDLMYGLPGQTAETWRTTLVSALEYKPEELYLYPLYVRPLTTLGRKGAARSNQVRAESAERSEGPKIIDHARVALYEQGRAMLLEAGYHQVSLRMFRRGASASGPVYCCQDDGMVGLGCGARSYTRGLHYSTEWAVGARGVRDIIDRWVQRGEAEFAAADYGFRLDADEQRRRWLILSLLSDEGLDHGAYHAKFGGPVEEHFPELAELAPRGLAERRGDVLALTHGGLARADALGPWLYSADVRTRMAEYELA
ncbi:MAG TPA: STM4012 family radical SAM protein [Kofleriaceae bacterium]|nr:STM4012 family radical SAM protein [Kofleriaceae bacterium]